MAKKARPGDVTIAIGRKRNKLDVLDDWRYRLFFDFLWLSPSYRLAHLIAVGKRDREKCVLPTDFDVVEATYAAFGSVYRTHFGLWWVRTAQYQFGVSAAPRAKSLLRINRREEVTKDMIRRTHDELDQFVLVDRAAQGNPATLIMAIPLQNDRKALLKQVSTLIEEAFGKEREQHGIASYHMIRNKVREHTLLKARDVVWGKSFAPKAKLFEIGNEANVSPANWSDPKLKRNKVEANKRENMEILTSRHLHRAYLLAENAARGKFPSFDPLPDDPGRPKFNYAPLGRRLRSYGDYVDREAKRIKEVLARRAQRRLEEQSKKQEGA